MYAVFYFRHIPESGKIASYYNLYLFNIWIRAE